MRVFEIDALRCPAPGGSVGCEPAAAAPAAGDPADDEFDQTPAFADLW